MPQRCLGAGKGEGRRGVLPPGSGQGPEPGTRGMGAGWEVSLSASLAPTAPLLHPPQPGLRGQTVGRWTPALRGFCVDFGGWESE